MSTTGIPPAKFDASRVTEPIKADVRRNVLALEDVEKKHVELVYDAALRSISAGRDLSVLYNALMQLNAEGMTKQRAAEIALLLNNKATSLMDRERLKALGLKNALWMYSGAPCEMDPTRPTGQDASHKAANRKQFEISKGMFLDDKWTWPGVEPGCKCVLRAIVHGFS